MKVDFSQTMTDLKGAAVMHQVGDHSEITKLSDVSLNALMALDEQDTVETKVRKFKLAVLINQGGEQDVSVEDVALLKTVIGKFYNPLAVGRAFELLDPNPQ